MVSVGSRGDSYDNALCESIIGLYKTELVFDLGPWRGLTDLEYHTFEWVDWWNHRRLFGTTTPIEKEEAHYVTPPQASKRHSHNRTSTKPGELQTGAGLHATGNEVPYSCGRARWWWGWRRTALCPGVVLSGVPNVLGPWTSRTGSWARSG